MTGWIKNTAAPTLAVVIVMSIGLCAILSGCFPGEGCQDFPTEVVLHTDRLSGPAPLTVAFTADAQGRSCGCCSDGESEIAEYRWDLDGDGVVDIQGASTSTASYTYTQAGTYTVTITVVDTRSDTAYDTATITVTQ